MRRIFFLFLFVLLFISINGFAQQNLPAKIIGRIPDRNSTKIYQIQVGAFTNERNADNAVSMLKKSGLCPVTERYQQFTRVIVKGIPAAQVVNFLVVIKQSGFNEVIIREDAPSQQVSAPPPPPARSQAFEFTPAIPDPDPAPASAEETMPPPFEREIIILEPELFHRVWQAVDCSNPEYIGYYLIVSEEGTFSTTTPDGEGISISLWRWHENKKNDFEYTHNNWATTGRAIITELTSNILVLFDPGPLSILYGFPRTNSYIRWEFVPVER
jgi:hypothetical protein